MRQILKRFILASITMLAGAVAFAQVTTSALSGRVTDGNDVPVVGAAVVAVHEPSGTSYGAITNNDGRYTIQGMRTGGPYRVEVSCLGYQQTDYTGIVLQLAETYNLNAQIAESNEFLSEALVVAAPTSKFAAQEKTGASTNISSEQMSRMPTISRSITDLAKISPYGGNGMSFSGADGRNVNFTVDGANFNNNFGLSDALPGGGSPISIDAIEEMQVVISPFDVRQTNFIGGGVNAITKSGTNTFKGTAYIYHQNENMHGNRVDREELSAREKDEQTTYGFTLGGPIIQNKLFFFVNAEYVDTPSIASRWRASENGVADVDQYISRTSVSDMQRVADELATYGYNPGSYTSFPAEKSNTKLLARIDWNITRNHHLAVRYNYTNNKNWIAPNASSSDATMRTNDARMSEYSMAFANSMYSMNNKVSTISVDFNSRLGNNLSNQFLATYSKIGDIRGTNSSKFPFIDILGNTYKKDGTMDTMYPYMSAGLELFTWNNAVHNNTFTMKDDVTYYMGSHKFTAGLSYEYQMADNQYMRNGTGYYRYSSLDDFLNHAQPETVAITYGYDGETEPAARVRFSQIGLYAQDDWNVTDKLKVNYGLRFDTIVFDNQDVTTNVKIQALDYGGRSVDTGKWPSTKIQISPRIGFTYDVFGDKSLKIRGGTGLFSGRLPLVFFTNMPSNSGMVQNVVSLSTRYSGGVGTPDANLVKFYEYMQQDNGGKMYTDTEKMIETLGKIDSDKFPYNTPTEKGVDPSTINGVDRKFKMPQVWKTSIAADYTFPTSFPLSVTGELTFNKTVNGVRLVNYNVQPNEGWSQLNNGADHRHVYPSSYKYTHQEAYEVTVDGKTETRYRTVNNPEAYVLTNTSKGYGWIGVLSVDAEPVPGLRLSASYTHTVSKELTGMPGSNASSAFTYIPTIEGPNYVGLHSSQYVNPDRLIASVSYSDKSGNHYSLFYQGIRYGGYSYIYSNDLNGDNYNYDALYIPASKDEIQFVSEADRDNFWAFLEQDSYLSRHKGKYAEAYAAVAPMVHVFDFRYQHDFTVKIGGTVNTLQFGFDLKNAGNLFNSKWGIASRLYTNTSYATPLRVDHIDENGVPYFASNVNGSTKTWLPAKTYGNCWYIQIGIKYFFN